MAKTKKSTEPNEEVKDLAKEMVSGKYGAMMRQAKENGTFEVMTPKFIEFKEPGVTVVGMYKGRTQVGGGDDKKPYYQYVFESDIGPIKFHLGNVTDGEAGALMEEGRVYAIQFLGQVDIPGAKRVNKFEIILLSNPDESGVGGKGDQPI